MVAYGGDTTRLSHSQMRSLRPGHMFYSAFIGLRDISLPHDAKLQDSRDSTLEDYSLQENILREIKEKLPNEHAKAERNWKGSG